MKPFKAVPPTVLFFNHYKDEARQHEIDMALKMNEKVFDRVIVISGRPTFEELFSIAQEGTINCYCNSDIYFESTELLHQVQPNECYAITRQDLIGTQYASGSQDAWIFRGLIKPVLAPFTMGLWGCDNRLAFELSKHYTVKNPSLSIRLRHLHAVDNRNYQRSPANTVPPPYLTLNPIEL